LQAFGAPGEAPSQPSVSRTIYIVANIRFYKTLATQALGGR
jgi:hypothetical protein